MNRFHSDKEIERQRYDCRAMLTSQSLETIFTTSIGSASVPLTLRQPYIEYEKLLSTYLSPTDAVLELCAGMGEFSSFLVSKSFHFIASDISPSSLSVLRSRFPTAQHMDTVVCDIEQLPFSSQSFELIACAGGLSYGDNLVVLSEIYRLLRPGGYFVCVDSLNHNPIYRINRLLHCLRGRRTLSTLNRMPTIKLLQAYEKTFDNLQIQFYGAFSWLLVPLSKVIGQSAAFRLSNALDCWFKIKSSAFKFVLIAQKCKIL
jgi:ubiquinone/menaquinone biosynthesis C-methylase UbiE